MIDDQEDRLKAEALIQAQRIIKAALWVSVMDASGGRASTLEERQAMIDVIRGFMREKDYKALYPALEIAIENHKAWDRWSRELADFTRELKTAAATMPVIERQCIYDLAYEVAVRFRERNFVWSFFVGLGASVKNFFRGEENKIMVSDYVNISTVEKSALNELADILGLPRSILP